MANLADTVLIHPASSFRNYFIEVGTNTEYGPSVILVRTRRVVYAAHAFEVCNPAGLVQ